LRRIGIIEKDGKAGKLSNCGSRNTSPSGYTNPLDKSMNCAVENNTP
jgi:hypothetical protein